MGQEKVRMSTFQYKFAVKPVQTFKFGDFNDCIIKIILSNCSWITFGQL